MSIVPKTKEDNFVETKEGKLILDSHKVSYHYDRVKAFENGIFKESHEGIDGDGEGVRFTTKNR